MNILKQMLSAYPFIVLDGALATELELDGFDLQDRLWSAKVLVENPDAIKKIHRAYLEADADIITTSSYQATIPGFQSKGYSADEARELIKFSVKIAADEIKKFWSDEKNRDGRPKPLVAGSAGSYGAFLANGAEYRGDYHLSESEYMDFHRERAGLLLYAGSDIIAFETVPLKEEALAIANLMEEFDDSCCWIVFSVTDAEHISSGEGFAQCVRELNRFDSVASIGINCSAPEHIKPLIDIAVNATDKPVIVYPNSGAVYNIKCSCWKGLQEDMDYGRLAEEWYRAGAKIIGGCCQIGPKQIESVSGFRKSLIK